MIKMLKLEFMKLWATDYFKVLTVFWVIAFLNGCDATSKFHFMPGIWEALAMESCS